MQCSVCERNSQNILHATCAQAALYPKRLDLLQAISSRDAASDKVEEHLESASEVKREVPARVETIKTRLEDLREETARLELDLLGRKQTRATLEKDIANRRQKLQRAEQETERLKQRVEDGPVRDTRRLNQKWNAMYAKTADARSFLCKEAANLYNLRVRKKKSSKLDYMIGGIMIPDFLQDLNHQNPLQITTSLVHVCHLVNLVTTYLGLKMPYEIIPPKGSSTSPSMRGLLSGRHIAVRSLALDMPLPELLRESSAAHTKFVEGLAMLCVNVGWLCHTQGFELSGEEACAPGAALHKLLVSNDPQKSQRFGQMSHSTVKGNLMFAPDGTALTGSFKLEYRVVAEKIRNAILSETMTADWDIVSEPEAAVAAKMELEERQAIEAAEERSNEREQLANSSREGDVLGPEEQEVLASGSIPDPVSRRTSFSALAGGWAKIGRQWNGG